MIFTPAKPNVFLMTVAESYLGQCQISTIAVFSRLLFSRNRSIIDALKFLNAMIRLN